MRQFLQREAGTRRVGMPMMRALSSQLGGSGQQMSESTLKVSRTFCHGCPTNPTQIDLKERQESPGGRRRRVRESSFGVSVRPSRRCDPNAAAALCLS
jgi:hypothetical protein